LTIREVGIIASASHHPAEKAEVKLLDHAEGVAG